MKRTVASEQYFTHPNYAQRCIDLLRQHYELSDFDFLVEPSAGAGVFVDLLQDYPMQAVDIEPHHPKVEKGDFFSWWPQMVEGSKILTIGNPPFGQRSALAVRFINRAAEFSDVVAFILPRAFNKYTFQDRVHRQFHLVESLMGEEFVDLDGNDISVKTVFQIWERREEIRELENSPSTHVDFEMKHAHLSRTSEELRAQLVSEYQFALPQVGAKFIPKLSGEITKGSWWFIKPNSEGVLSRFQNLDFSDLDDMNTAHKSIGKRDIVRAYTAVLLKLEQSNES